MFPAMVHKVITVALGTSPTEVDLGFIPDWVVVRNRNAATTEIIEWQWGKALADGAGYKVTINTTDGDMTIWAASGGDISKLDTRTVNTTDPISITMKKGIKIAAAFHDTSDVIDVIAWKTDL